MNLSTLRAGFLLIAIALSNFLISQDCAVYNLNNGSGTDELAIWLMSGPYADEYVFTDNGIFSQNEDGTAQLTGTVASSSNPAAIFEVDVNFVNGSTWSEWQALGRGYKDEPGIVGDNYLDYTYYEMDNANSTLTGSGDLDGAVLALSHAPANFYYGFQVGVGANATTAVEGMGGWFMYSSDGGNGQGDILLESDCDAIFDCPNLLANIGDGCNDGDDTTENDTVGDDCVCAGTPIISTPENDLCADATPIACGDVLAGTTTDATVDETLGTCGTSLTSSGGVWYAFEGTGQVITASTCNDADFDTKIGVFTGACDALECAGGLDDTPGCAGFTQEFTWDSEAGTTYYIYLTGFSTATGNFNLSLTCAAFDCPDLSANIGDACDDGDATTINDTVTADCLCIGESTEVPGCADETACNYNPDATTDDGSCEYVLWYIPTLSGDGPALMACSAPDGYELADQDCAQTVVDNDSFCVNTSFDGICYDAYDACLAGPCDALPASISTTSETTICTDDGEDDLIDVSIDDAGAGSNSAYVITDAGLTILAIAAASPINFESAGAGTYLIWYLNFADDFPGAEVGANAADLVGCFALSNPITITGLTGDDCPGGGPDNDLCADATPIACGDALAGSTTNATADESLGTCGTILTTAGGVWYSFVGTGQEVTASTCDAADYDTKIGVFTGACDALECVDGNDDGAGCTGFTSLLTWTAEEGTAYSIYVTGWNANIGDFTLSLTCEDIVVEGCTDPAACNYNPDATTDDGSCDFGLWYLPIDFSAPSQPLVLACSAPDGYELADQDCAAERAEADPFCVTTDWDQLCQDDYEDCLGIVDCPDLALNIGDPCDDGDITTEFDTVTADCVCVGTPIVLPPANDDCAGALPLTCDVTVTGSTTNATDSGLEVACDGFSSGTPEDVFYTFDADGTSDYTISLGAGADGLLDGALFIFSGACDDLTYVTCADANFPAPSGEEITLSAPAAGTYTVRLFNWNAGGADFTLDLTCAPASPFDCPDLEADFGDDCDDEDATTENDIVTAECECLGTPIPPAPANDLCADATPIACGDALAGSTTNATADESLGTCGTILTTAGGVWYSFVGTGQEVTASTCDAADYDTKIGVFTGACDALECVDGNDDGAGCTGFTSLLTWTAEEGTAYSIYVTGWNANTGDFTLSLTCEDIVIEGCTDPAACNYNPDATTDDGSCDFGLWYLPIDFSAPSQPLVLACSAPDGYELADQDCAAERAEADPFCVTTDWDQLCQDDYEDCLGIVDCPDLALNIGDPCDDGDITTEFDTVTADCVCVGTPIVLPPANDDCAGALPLTCDVTVTGSTTNATDSGLEVACDGFSSGTPEDVFYTFDADGTSDYTISLGAGADGLLDGALFIFSGACDDLTYVTCADANFPAPSGEEITLSAPAAGTYTVRLFNWNAGGADFTLDLTCTPASPFDCPDLEADFGDDCDDEDATTENDIVTAECECLGTPIPPAPANDLCADATPIACGDALAGSTTNATADESLGTCGTILTTAGGVWYSFVGTGQEVTASTCDAADYDTKIGVFTGSCDALECVDGNDDGAGCTGFTSLLTWTAEEGIAYSIYVTGWNANIGDFTLSLTCADAFDCPDISANFGDACDDLDANTADDIIQADCSCAGTFQDADGDGVGDADDVCPGFDDTLLGTACDDGDANTTGDVYTDCDVCAGTFQDADGDGVGDADDVCPGFDDTLLGTPCDDGDANTTGDIYTDCDLCAGTFQDADGDGVGDADDVCPGFDDTLLGTPCDDGDANTTGDIYTDCDLCAGTFQDADGDGVGDADDVCPGFDDTLLGSACDDGDANTTGDIYTDCDVCAGTFQDADGDGVGDADDVCPGFDDTLLGTPCDDGDANTENDTYVNCECVGGFVDTDGDGVGDADDVCPGFDDTLLGSACDDGDANTTGDVYTDCDICAGTFQDADGDGVGDADDVCPGFDDTLLGAACDDGDANTTGDIYTDCDVCAGTFQDADGDGVGDADDVCPGFDDTLLGTPCDDGDANTTGDIYTDCDVCAGTFQDADGDGVGDADDVCPGFDDTLLGTPCDDGDVETNNDVYVDCNVCQGIATFDCPDLSLNEGDPCNDGDDLTENDIVHPGCTCIGTPVLDPCPLAGAGLEGVFVEKYYVADADDAAYTIFNNDLAEGAVTYRIYLDMADGYELETVYGVGDAPLEFGTTTEFYNAPILGSNSGAANTNDQLGSGGIISTLALDSWLTFGLASSTQVGTPKVLDTDGSFIGGINNPNGLLANDDPTAGIPLTDCDGLVAGEVGDGGFNFIGDVGALSTQFFGSVNAGGTFSASNGAYAILGGSAGTNAQNQILIGQFTTDGTFSFNLNFRLGAPDGTSEDYLHTECSQLSYSSDPLPPGVNPLGSLGAVLKAYPNPTTGEMINLQIDNLPAEGEFVTIELTDVFGQTFPVESFTNDDLNSLRTLTFDQPLSNGVYILSVKYNGFVETQRIVISK